MYPAWATHMTSPPTTAPTRPQHRSSLLRRRRPTAATVGEEGSSASTVVKEDGLLTSGDVGRGDVERWCTPLRPYGRSGCAGIPVTRAQSSGEEAAVHVGSGTGRSRATGQ